MGIRRPLRSLSFLCGSRRVGIFLLGGAEALRNYAETGCTADTHRQPRLDSREGTAEILLVLGLKVRCGSHVESGGWVRSLCVPLSPSESWGPRTASEAAAAGANGHISTTHAAYASHQQATEGWV